MTGILIGKIYTKEMFDKGYAPSVGMYCEFKYFIDDPKTTKDVKGGILLAVTNQFAILKDNKNDERVYHLKEWKYFFDERSEEEKHKAKTHEKMMDYIENHGRSRFIDTLLNNEFPDVEYKGLTCI